jgi:two-component sensor histidine kinase
VTTADLPESLLHTVIRTRESVILDDASAQNPFSEDEYIRQKHARSILCLPLVKQAKLIGVLYLENNLTPHVFTPARLAVLKLLASQAAISLDNARLYTDLRLENSERKRAEEQLQASLEEKEALLKEVHHRVKNNLQLINSLLSLQAARIAEPAVAELFAESRNRVRSMALVHENLYWAGNFAGISMATHIQNLCAHLTRAYGMNSQRVELAIRIGDVELDLDRAVPCGLIVNELVSNALKHAFPDSRAGRVRIELQPLGDKQHVLVVGDDGVGLPPDLDYHRADSLGLQLVDDLTQQLHGNIMVNREGGTTFTITFDTDRRMERKR